MIHTMHEARCHPCLPCRISAELGLGAPRLSSTSSPQSRASRTTFTDTCAPASGAARTRCVLMRADSPRAPGNYRNKGMAVCSARLPCVSLSPRAHAGHGAEGRARMGGEGGFCAQVNAARAHRGGGAVHGRQTHSAFVTDAQDRSGKGRVSESSIVIASDSRARRGRHVGLRSITDSH